MEGHCRHPQNCKSEGFLLPTSILFPTFLSAWLRCLLKKLLLKQPLQHLLHLHFQKLPPVTYLYASNFSMPKIQCQITTELESVTCWIAPPRTQSSAGQVPQSLRSVNVSSMAALESSLRLRHSKFTRSVFTLHPQNFDANYAHQHSLQLQTYQNM